MDLCLGIFSFVAGGCRADRGRGADPAASRAALKTLKNTDNKTVFSTAAGLV